MNFTVLTLFPELVDNFFHHGMIGRAVKRNLILGHCVNIRDFTTDRHRTVDDRPYGGGSGMVMKPDPLGRAIQSARKRSPHARVILMTPQGKRFDQDEACRIAREKQDIIFVCGRYEGIDERVHERFVDAEMSIGDYVLTGGELAAMVIIDATARLIPGVLGKEDSPLADSFMGGRLEHAQYTRPENFEGIQVPPILLSGDHGKIARWRVKSGLVRTFFNRPDLFEQTRPSAEEKKILLQWADELKALAGD